MKKLLTLALACAFSFSFAAESTNPLIAFGHRPKMQNGEPIQRTKFFVSYKLFLAQPEGNNRYANINDVNNITFLRNNYDWGFLHLATIGAQIPKTLFKLFAEGWFFSNTKRKTNQVTAPAFISSAGFSGFNAGFNALQVKAKLTTDFYSVNLLVSYAAYRKGNFFFIPYVGPRWMKFKEIIIGNFTDNVDNATLTRDIKRRGFGSMFAIMLKYFFTNRFYAFGDFRYTILFQRRTFFGSGISTNQNANTGTLNDTVSDSDEIFELAFGLGGLIVDERNWNFAIDGCYKLLLWDDAAFYFQALGIGVRFGF